MQPKQVKILDTTLRDGQQCPGAGMSFENNIAYAKLVVELGIDVLEAGFPSASELDFNIVNTIAQECASKDNHTIISSLCQLREAQIDCTIDALTPAQKVQRGRLHVYVPADPDLMQASLGKYAENKPQIVEDTHRLVKRAVTAGLEVEFTAEGYSRIGENFDFVTDLFRAAITAGATIMNCPDTIGGACRLQGPAYFVEKMRLHRDLMQQEFPDYCIDWSAHCHNDYGLALDNSMNAVFSGVATQVEGCFNGIGERAGNVALEQCVMFIKHFGHYYEGEAPLYTGIKTEYLQRVSDFIHENMLPRQPHWPITGDNAARHTSGGHTNAVLANPLAYQPFDPKEVGKEISFVFGPMSGGNHAQATIKQNGYICKDNEKAEIAQFIKKYYSDRRKGITDQELVVAYKEFRKPIKIRSFSYTKSNQGSSLVVDGKFFEVDDSVVINYTGQDSALAALHKRVQKYMPGLQIEDYKSCSIGKGIDALSEASIDISLENGNHYQDSAVDQDIEVSALKALVSVVNGAYIEEHYREDN